MLEEAPQLIVMMSNYERKAPELRQCNVDSIHVQAWKVDPLMCEYFKLLVKDIKGKAKENLYAVSTQKSENMRCYAICEEYLFTTDQIACSST